MGGCAATRPPDPEGLAADFMALAFRAEVLERGRGGPAPLTRWERRAGDPLRFALEGGDPEDRALARALLARLEALTGLSFAEAAPPALRIRFLNPQARRAEGALAQDFRALRRLWATDEAVFCLALGETGEDGALKRAEVLLKSEAPAERRRACLYEELAQAMGLFDDAAARGASVFNDDDRHAEWTARDEDLMRLLYDPRLKPGAQAEEAAALVDEIAREAGMGGRP